MIKNWVFFLLMGILFLNSLSFVSAYWVDDVFDLLVPTSNISYSDSSLWIIKALLGLLIFFIIFFIVRNSKILGDNLGIQIVLGVIPALIFMRYVSLRQLEGVFFAYQSVGLVLLIGLKFLIIVYLIYTGISVSSMRRLAVFGFWFVYSIIVLRRVGFEVYWSSRITLLITAITAFVILFDNWVKKKVEKNK